MTLMVLNLLLNLLRLKQLVLQWARLLEALVLPHHVPHAWQLLVNSPPSTRTGSRCRVLNVAGALRGVVKAPGVRVRAARRALVR